MSSYSIVRSRWIIAVLTVVALWQSAGGAAEAVGGFTLPDLPGAAVRREAVLFGFDRRAFPFQAHVQTHLVQGQSPTSVLRPGPPGSHDEFIRFYGTVLHVNGVYHLWYFGEFGAELAQIGLGQGGREDKVAPTAPRIPFLCYARSRDGLTWEKPKLGLVEFAGSRENNIVELPSMNPITPAAAILHDPEDPNPERRFKLAYEVRFDGQNRFCVAFSADGLSWKPSPKNPVGPFFEMAGIAKWGGLYYVCGQDGVTAHRPFRTRALATFASADFETWSPVASAGLDRNTDPTGPLLASEWNQREEIHLGATLWNRGNVLLGVYGQWHGHPTGDRRLVSIDLGLALSHDALHYEEPVPGFRLIPAREQPESINEMPALMQGQGFEHIGERTYFWYSTWRGYDRAGVRAVSWERDRLGFLQPYRPSGAQAISTRIAPRPGAAPRLTLNASGLSQHSRLRVSLVDGGFRPVAGYSGSDAATIESNGLAQPVRWSAGERLPADRGELRVLVEFAGVRPEDARLHAVYIHAGNP